MIEHEARAVFHASLPGNRSAFLLAHLLPGEVLVVETSQGRRELSDDGDGLPCWMSVYDDEDGLRFCRFGTAARLVGNTPERLRGPVTAAVRDLHDGGVAIMHREQAPHHRSMEWRPTTHQMVEL
ncbi:hypothetical protein GFY24_38885 [Nocardia sp. SYP-A9097]|uniref:hypothetical protein n=1 Tax=Nocardia sp. SYP-A9097 TaxID=2663237 RepID=UPI00129B3E70|nr:hypothetical protein [Nocardia sp. SYP-A9097]MRH93316.1 hypothetical protein [Nocardia sp. SYP-A9097]